MPELPEVETFRRFLSPRLKGKKIQKVEVYWPSLIKKPNLHLTFQSKLINQTFLDLERKGKFLLFFLSDYVLVSHLRMEGKFFFTEHDQSALMQHCLCKFTFSDNTYLFYVDSRHFGTFHLENKATYLENSGLKKLGLEPFNPKLTEEYLAHAWKHRTICIKTALLEQTVVTGIGNIYACEILFASRISPFQKVNQLTAPQLQKIIVNCRQIMLEAIAMKGTTIHTFNVNNQKGLYFIQLKVYARQDKPCFNCRTLIIREKINGRGTFYCRHCQKNLNC